MSIDAIRWAWTVQGLKPAQKLVLLSLADRANEHHVSWPAIPRLAKDTGLDQRSIYRTIKSLAALGVISITPSPGGKETNKYQLIGVEGREDTPDKLSPLTECHPTPDTVLPLPLTECQNTPDRMSPNPKEKPKEEPKGNPNTRARAKSAEYSASFLEFWTIYPLKVGKDAAYKAWKNAKAKHPDATTTQIITAIKGQIAADHFIGNDGQAYIPHPSTWLNQARWTDEVRTQEARASPSVQSRQERESEANKLAFLRSVEGGKHNIHAGN